MAIGHKYAWLHKKKYGTVFSAFLRFSYSHAVFNHDVALVTAVTLVLSENFSKVNCEIISFFK